MPAGRMQDTPVASQNAAAGRAAAGSSVATARDFQLRLVKVYSGYRFVLAVLLLVLFSAHLAPNIVGATRPQLYLGVSALYAAFAATALLYLLPRRFGISAAAIFAQLVIDIVALTLLMHASGGLHGGIGFLVLVTVASASIIFTGGLALLVAAVASICITLESLVVSALYRDDSTTFPAGLLGVLLFVTSLIFQAVNRRLRDAEALAGQEASQAALLQRLNEMIVQRMRTGIVVVDANQQIELINQAAVEYLGGHNPAAPLCRGASLRAVAPLLQRLEHWQTHPWQRNTPFQAKTDGSEIQANFATLHQGDRQHTLVFLEDIRSIAHHAQQIKLASLGKLTGSIAHEIRNPLGAISHAAQLLAEQVGEQPALRRLTDIIDRHVQRVAGIVESIMGLSRRQSPAFQKFALRPWLERFSLDYRASAQVPCTLAIFANEVSPQVLFDPTHLYQVLTNLVDNAVRHGTAAGETPWVGLEIRVDDALGLPYLNVHDRGPGVDPAHRDRLFEPFFTTAHGGTGLGLYLARELCETNYATLSYLPAGAGATGCFRIGFVHPDKQLPI